jgi:hypothetical protein
MAFGLRRRPKSQTIALVGIGTWGMLIETAFPG